MKHLFLTSVFSLAATTFAYAEEPLQMVIQSLDGQKSIVEASGLKINFTESELVANNATQSISLPLASIDKLFFIGDTLSVDDIFDQGFTGSVEIFTVDGIKSGSFDSIKEAEESLPGDLYIVKSGGKAIKILLGK